MAGKEPLQLEQKSRAVLEPLEFKLFSRLPKAERSALLKTAVEKGRNYYALPIANKESFYPKENDLLIAYYRGKPIGSARFEKPKRENKNIVMGRLFVLPLHRNKGVGKALFRKLSELAKNEWKVNLIYSKTETMCKIGARIREDIENEKKERERKKKARKPHKINVR